MTNWSKVNRAKARRSDPHGMNATEARYATILASSDLYLKHSFESIRLQLADRTTYTPDFYVLTKELAIEFHEVKGARGYKLDPSGRVKLKVAAAMYPEFRFLGCVERLKRDGRGFVVSEIKTRKG